MKPAASIFCALLFTAFALCGCGPRKAPEPVETVIDAPSDAPVYSQEENLSKEPEATNAYLNEDQTLKESASASAQSDLFYNAPQSKLREPLIKVYKKERRLELLDGETVIGRFRIGLGFAAEGDKEKEGDGKTPIGDYYVCMRNPNSRFHLSLGVSYPSVKDAKRGKAEGLIDNAVYEKIVDAIGRKASPPWNTALGGEICIHGNGSGSDWTLGCIALDDADMDILFAYCPLKTPILIYE